MAYSDFLFTSVAAGVVATGGMTFLMHVITALEITNADMVKAIGSIVTRSLKFAWPVGMVLHLSAGIAFAILYVGLFTFTNPQRLADLVGTGAVFGAAHGFVVTLLLVTVVAKRHPLKEFREAGLFVGAAHFFGHVLYGALVGLVAGFMGLGLAGRMNLEP